MVSTSELASRTVWHVPVMDDGSAARRLRFFRLRDGRRCAIGFSSAEALTELLGPGQAIAELSEPALRALTDPLGVHTLVLDPRLVAPSVPVTRSVQLQHG
ncbi:SAV_915 family protein [Kitasatospora sp. NPDC004240]